MSQTKTVFGCWNNERNISIDGQAGKLHPMLFDTEARAREYYKYPNASSGDVIVRVTCEAIADVST